MVRRFWLGTLAVVAAVSLAVLLVAQVRLAALVLMGRSPHCPLSQAIQSAENLQQQIQIKDRMIAGSRLLQTDAAGFEEWATPKGNFWIPKDNRFVLPFNLAEQERKIYGSGDRGVRPGDVVLDCGANVGAFAREALKAGAKLVVAIEPAPENLECLRRNFKAEVASGKIVIYAKGLWDKDDFLTLQVDAHNSAADSFVLHPHGSHASDVKLPLTTIDKLVGELGLERVDFIKMDIEGAETRALTGARATLARFRPRMAISAYHEPGHPKEIPQVVRAAKADYRLDCGPCAETGGGIRPDILYFQ